MLSCTSDFDLENAFSISWLWSSEKSRHTPPSSAHCHTLSSLALERFDAGCAELLLEASVTVLNDIPNQYITY